MNYCAMLMEPLKLTPSRTLAVAFLHEHPGVDQTSLGEAMGMNRGSTMMLVDNLESTGFVRRAPGSDRRSNALYLTKQGEKALKAALEINDKLMLFYFDWMTNAERALFSRITDEIIARSSKPIKERAARRRSATSRARIVQKPAHREPESVKVERKRKPGASA